MTASHDPWHVSVVAHELLGHALTGRSLGHTIRTVVTTPGAQTAGWSDHWPKAGLSPLEEAADKVTIDLAGELAARIVPLEGYLGNVDGCADRAEQTALAVLRLPAEEAWFFRQAQAPDSSSPRPSDSEKAEAVAAEAGGQDHALFLAFCAARARRLIAANLALFLEVLLPLGLESPILTGADVEQAIGAARSGHERSTA